MSLAKSLLQDASSINKSLSKNADDLNRGTQIYYMLETLTLRIGKPKSKSKGEVETLSEKPPESKKVIVERYSDGVAEFHQWTATAVGDRKVTITYDGKLSPR